MVGENAKRILVLEEDRMLAARLAELLANAGYEVAGPACNVLDAKRAVGIEGVDGAVIDADLKRENSLPLAGEITRQGASVLLVTSIQARNGRGERPAFPQLKRDFTREEFLGRISALFARRPPAMGPENGRTASEAGSSTYRIVSA